MQKAGFLITRLKLYIVYFTDPKFSTDMSQHTVKKNPDLTAPRVPDWSASSLFAIISAYFVDITLKIIVIIVSG